ncbi:unnamed protein product [Adineta steineri]|uniref:Uncharacterized protein n=1 Tax=Adineta steineri TaxID=433720 RepID=A0A815BHT8_9BILA|nr:unnamed protein product [Adineta steineri]CAF3989750.1 unnamed protein product [Adineta steineri]
MLYLCRFFIRDIRTELAKHQYPNPVRVYRGQRMSRLELEQLQNMIDQLVVVKSILSTSTSREVAKIFLSYSHDSQTEDQKKPVLFEIDADPHMYRDEKKPFANITELSNFDTEEEVLFMYGSIFRLTDVYYQDDIWNVKMSLWKFEETELQPVLDMLGDNQTNPKGNKSPLEFICLLSGFDQDDLVVKLTKQYLLELTWGGITNYDYSIEIAKCYHRLGFTDLKRSLYDSALEWFSKALEMFATVIPTTHLFTAATHLSMGDIFSGKGDIKQAHNEYQIALNIYERDYGIEHPTTKACRENIVWHISRKMKSFRRPIDFWQPLTNIKDDQLSTIQSEHIINVLTEEQITALSSLSAEDMLKQLQSILNSNTASTLDGSQLGTRNIKLHPLVNAAIANRNPFPFITGIITYRCPCCKEPVWIYRLFSMFKGSPCFRCIGKTLKLKRK